MFFKNNRQENASPESNDVKNENDGCRESNFVVTIEVFVLF